jgi:glycosyltransferase involved in cell wall biosynthesis
LRKNHGIRAFGKPLNKSTSDDLKDKYILIMIKKLRNLHRKYRKKIKLFFKPEVSKKNFRQFYKKVGSQQRNPANLLKPSSITVVIPCYGHGPYLKEMFTSLIQQSRQPEAIIFVIDDSPDNSLEILQELISSYQDQTPCQFEILINEKNLGQAATLNHGISHVKTDLIMILNDDDYLMHDCVEVMLELFEKFPHVCLMGGHSLAFGQNELANLPKHIQSICPMDQIPISISLPSRVKHFRSTNSINMTHSSSTFYKSAWEAVGGYFPNKEDRVVPNSDRDFQMRVNALFPVGISYEIPLSCWRNYSSVDHGINS